MSAAHTQLHRHLLIEAALLHRARRDSSLTGAAALRELLKAKSSSYSRLIAPSIAQVPLRADCIDEPSGDNAVELLDALDHLESSFYRDEENALEPEGKSAALFEEIQEHYGFIG